MVFPHGILLVLYNTLILPYISYGILAWGNSGAGTINRILQLQKKALRIINNVNFCEHSNPLFYNCNTLKVTDVYSLQLGSFMYQLNNLKLPQSICSMFLRNEEFHYYFTRQSDEFHRSFARTKLAKSSVKHAGPKLWSFIDFSLKCAYCLSAFKHKYKSKLLINYLSND